MFETGLARERGRRARSCAALAVAVMLLPACGPSEPIVLEMRTSGSQTAFMPDTLRAPAGHDVVLRLINDGEIAHNVVLVRDTASVQPIVLAAYQSIATEYVPTGFEEQILASTPLVYPGDTVDVSFVMPAAGRYPYVCVFPGHGSTMRGTLLSTS